MHSGAEISDVLTLFLSPLPLTFKIFCYILVRVNHKAVKFKTEHDLINELIVE